MCIVNPKETYNMQHFSKTSDMEFSLQEAFSQDQRSTKPSVKMLAENNL